MSDFQHAHDMYNRALNTNAQKEEQAISGGLSEARGLLDQGGSFSNQLATPEQGALSQAIKNKVNKQFNADDQELKRTLKLDAKNAQFSKLQQATGLAAQESQINFQKAMAKYKQKMARKAARGQLLGSVLGIAGGAVGAIYGGPAGAMAGYQLGAGVGNMVGGQ